MYVFMCIPIVSSIGCYNSGIATFLCDLLTSHEPPSLYTIDLVVNIIFDNNKNMKN